MWEIVNKINHRYSMVSVIIPLIMMISAIVIGGIFEFAVSLGILVMAFIQLYLSSASKSSEEIQKIKCRKTGYLILIPALLTIAAGVSLVFIPLAQRSIIMTVLGAGLPGVLMMCTFFKLFEARKTGGTAARFQRLNLTAVMAVCLPLIVVPILDFTGSDETAVMGGMTAAIAGAAVLLTGSDMILVSICGYKGTRESIDYLKSLVRENSLNIVRISLLKDAFMVMGKTVLSVISASFFMFANALYSTGIGAARFAALKMHKQDKKRQVASYRIVGVILSIAGLCYVLYALRLFFGGSTAEYSMNIALIIALYTFVEFGINIREALRMRKSRELEAKALRAISLASTLLCFVLTQTAIMSFTSQGDTHVANALSGVIFGGLATLVGIYVIADSLKKHSVQTSV